MADNLPALREFKQTVESDAWRPKLDDALADGSMSTSRFIRSALTAIETNPYLLKCDRNSLLISMQSAALAGLDPHPAHGLVAFVPRKGKVSLQIMAKGLIQLAYASGRIAAIDTGLIYEADSYTYEEGTAPTLRIQRSLEEDPGEPVAYYCITHYRDGVSIPTVMTRRAVEQHRDAYSDDYKNRGQKSVWAQNFDEMAQKTVLRRAAKRWPIALPSAGGSHEVDERPAVVDAEYDAVPRSGDTTAAAAQVSDQSGSQDNARAATGGQSRLDALAGAGE
jgi:phage RecT family recombinase